MTLNKDKKKCLLREFGTTFLVGLMIVGLLVVVGKMLCRSSEGRSSEGRSSEGRSSEGRNKKNNREDYTVMIANDKPGASPPYTTMQQGGWGGQVNATVTGNIETIGKGCPCMSLDGGTRKVTLGPVY